MLGHHEHLRRIVLGAEITIPHGTHGSEGKVEWVEETLLLTPRKTECIGVHFIIDHVNETKNAVIPARMNILENASRAAIVFN